jgi:putative transcription factor
MLGFCDICGKNTKTRPVLIENAEIEACYSCYGREEIEKKPAQRKEIIKEKEEEIVENYDEIIKEAMKSKNIDEKKLAMLTNISESYLRHILNKEMLPDKKTAKKIEKALCIKIVEVVYISAEQGKDNERKNEKGITLADSVEWEDGR